MATIEKRKDQDGSTRYRVKVRLKGHPPASATFERLTDAKRWASQTETEIREGRYFAKAAAQKHTLQEATKAYRQVRLGELKDSKERGRLLDWWTQEIGAYALAEVTPARIAECRDKLASEPIPSKRKKPDPDAPPRYRTPARVARYLSALSPVLEFAVREKGWLDANPIRKVKKPQEARGRVRFLDTEERERLLAACDQATDTPELRVIVLMALTTGARRGEIANLRWRQVDLARKVVTLEDSKNGDRRALPLVGPALAALKEHAKVRPLDGSKLVFPGRSKKTADKPLDVERAWQTALRRAEIEDFRFHDLRHTAASYLAMSGSSLAEIAEVLGHRTLSMVKRYAHLSHAHTAGVLERMATSVFGASADADDQH